MPDEKILREQARTAIRDGKLPSRPADRTWGGPGVGASCSVCGAPITKDQMEFEIQFARDGGLDKFHVHIRCFAAWELERGGGAGRVVNPPLVLVEKIRAGSRHTLHARSPR